MNALYDLAELAIRIHLGRQAVGNEAHNGKCPATSAQIAGILAHNVRVMTDADQVMLKEPNGGSDAAHEARNAYMAARGEVLNLSDEFGLSAYFVPGHQVGLQLFGRSIQVQPMPPG